MLVRECHQGDRPGLHYQSPGLVQRTVLYSITGELMRRLQSVQNAVARLITGIRRCTDHISPVLRQLHWLPARQRVPSNLADDCRLVTNAGVRNCVLLTLKHWSSVAHKKFFWLQNICCSSTLALE